MSRKKHNRHQMHPNSLEALKVFEINGTLTTRKNKIYLLLDRLDRPLTRKDLADRLGCDSGGVTYPVKMLIDSGVIKELYNGINESTGYKAAFLGLEFWNTKKEPPTGQLPLLFGSITSNYRESQR